MEMKSYTAVVLGAGPGGYPCAIRLGQLGVKTLVIEREYWGGVCLNVGCIPSKALITAGKRVEEITHAGAMGIEVASAPVVNMTKLQAWKSSVVNKLTGGVRTLLKANKVDMMVGEARFFPSSFPASPSRTPGFSTAPKGLPSARCPNASQ